MRIFKWIALLLLIILVAVSIYGISLLFPVDAATSQKQDITIVTGQSTSNVAASLVDNHLIKNQLTFELYVKLISHKIIPGTYELSASSSASDIASMLADGQFKTTKITIIEGWRVTQIADYLQQKQLNGTKDFATKAQAYEGYLFPDTYEVKIDITSDELITLMRNNFKKRTKDLKLTPETVILASIVEREAASDEDRPLIAGVYANRLTAGMKLEADPTVQYAKGNWEAVTLDDYHSVISPYNTYLNDGLPPGPICNPGLASLEAAANPAQHDYLYFFHAHGQTYFSKTLAEHQAKIRQYFN